MLTINDAIDYATDHEVVITDSHTLKSSKRKVFKARKGEKEIMIQQTSQGSRTWKVGNNHTSRANAIVIAVNSLIGKV